MSDSTDVLRASSDNDDDESLYQAGWCVCVSDCHSSGCLLLCQISFVGNGVVSFWLKDQNEIWLIAISE